MARGRVSESPQTLGSSRRTALEPMNPTEQEGREDDKSQTEHAGPHCKVSGSSTGSELSSSDFPSTGRKDDRLGSGQAGELRRVNVHMATSVGI